MDGYFQKGQRLGIPTMTEEQDIREKIANAEAYKEITGGGDIPNKFFGEADKISSRKTKRACQPQIPYFKDNARALPAHERLGRQARRR